jgi:D-beta-D-heptose 7-phosphate kinase / D-beta-D-heptose 1-phosphate adenosyltransferase
MINVIGDIIIDEYWHGRTTRLSPEAPVPIVELGSKHVSLGGASNVYSNLKSLTKDVKLLGLVHEDYKHYFDDTTHLISTRKMPVKIRIISDSHYITRVDDEEYMDNNPLIDHLLVYGKKLKPNDIFFISDYAKGTIASPSGIINYLNMREQRIIVDPKLSLDHYKNSWLLKPNRKEFESYAGKSSNIKGIKQKAIEIRKELNVSHLVITLSEDGVLWISEDNCEHIPTRAKSVYDVTGAGDTFGAVLAYGLDKNMSMLDSLKLANKAAAKAVSKNGTYVIKKSDIE